MDPLLEQVACSVKQEAIEQKPDIKYELFTQQTDLKEEKFEHKPNVEFKRDIKKEENTCTNIHDVREAEMVVAGGGLGILCPVCSKHFYYERYLDMHMNLRHPDSLVNQESGMNKVESVVLAVQVDSEVKSDQNSDIGSEADGGVVNEQNGDSVNDYNAQVVNKEDYIVMVMSGSNEATETKESTRSDSDTTQQRVSINSFLSRLKRGLSNHMESLHTDEKQYVCGKCQRRFMNKVSLRNHMRVHSNGKRFSCPVCTKMYTYNKALQIHIKRLHDEKNNSQCFYNFNSDVTLDKNMQLKHTEPKPYSCSKCSYKCTTKCILQRHVAISHSKNVHDSCSQVIPESSSEINYKSNAQQKNITMADAKVFKCGWCSYSFFKSDDLKHHEDRYHLLKQSNQCPYCRFVSPSSESDVLKEHIIRIHIYDPKRYHVEENSFSCPECPSKFRFSKGLIWHMQTHPNFPFFSCPLCSDRPAFNDEIHLIRHIEQCHISRYI